MRNQNCTSKWCTADDDDHHRDIEQELPRPPGVIFFEVTWSSNVVFGDINNIYIDCCICLDEFKRGDLCRLGSTCKHLFHKNCIDKWLQMERRCPLCGDHVVLVL
ncbi:hypothetical protein ACOSQ2_025110 [Xanthoceras sorbifolium]